MSVKNERGGLLIEHQIAIVMLALVVAAAFNFMSIGLMAQLLAREHSRATSLAQRKMEEIRAAGPEALIAQPRQAFPVESGRRFEWQIDVATRAADLREVTATVFWQTRGRERSVSLVTYMRGR